MPHSRSNVTGTTPTPSKSPARASRAQNKPRGAETEGVRSGAKTGSGDAVKGRAPARSAKEGKTGGMGIGTGRGKTAQTPSAAPKGRPKGSLR